MKFNGLSLCIPFLLSASLGLAAEESLIPAATLESEADVILQADEMVIGGARIPLKQDPAQTISVESSGAGTRPSLEGALQGQANIQVVPTPLRGANISVGGFSGEHVALFWDNDPILGRVDGALDARSVSLGTVDHISFYQGLDSLPYGNQNVGGVVHLESPWKVEEPRVRIKTAGGNFGRTILDGRVAKSSELRNWHAIVSASNWRTEAVRTRPDAIDTVVDSSARYSASGIASRTSVATVAGKDIDVRVGAKGFGQNSKGVLSGSRTETDIMRAQVFADARRGSSEFHTSFSEYRNHYVGLGADNIADRDDRYSERLMRFGPEVKETLGNLTLLGGAIGEVQSTESTRMPGGKINRTVVGTHAGARYALNGSWVIGAGTRYDSGPQLVSPRAELRYLFQAAGHEHTMVLESGMGFREASPKERYHDFTNPALRYRVLGNSALRNERSWLSAIRYNAETKRYAIRASAFQMRMRDAIGFTGTSAGTGTMTYININQTRTFGAQLGGEYRLPHAWIARADYQWLRGRNLENNSALFLQPAHRVAMSLLRELPLGFTLLSQAVWTGNQGFFDTNRDRKVDASEVAGAYWTASLEAGYGFHWSHVAEIVHVFARVDNAFNLVREETFPLEPRSFLMGATVDL